MGERGRKRAEWAGDERLGEREVPVEWVGDERLGEGGNGQGDGREEMRGKMGRG